MYADNAANNVKKFCKPDTVTMTNNCCPTKGW